MITVGTVGEVREFVDRARRCGATLGFVPTMGALHAGHISLVSAARRECDLVMTSIFVNPLQFDEVADLDGYPRTFDADLRAVHDAGCDLIFNPSADEMYPDGASATTVEVAEISEPLEGANRPGHFRGVATVVTKLLSIFECDRAYFGRKDAQQLILIERLVADLSLRCQIVACPTIREHDGLAMSSRNRRLDPADRAVAPVIYSALLAGAEFVTSGGRDPKLLVETTRSVLETEPRFDIEYVDVRDARTMRPIESVDGEVLLALAGRFGSGSMSVRLLDNVFIRVDGNTVDVDAGEIEGVP